MEFGNIQNRETTETQSRLVDLQGWRSREVMGKRYQLSTVLEQCYELASLSTIQMLLLLLLLLFHSLGEGGLATESENNLGELVLYFYHVGPGV